MSGVLADLRYAVRLFAKSWGFTLVAFSALAIGIGVNTTIFGFVSNLILRPLDVTSPERLVRVDIGGSSLMPLLNYSEYEEYRDRNQSFQSLAMFHSGGMYPVRIDGVTDMIAVTPISGNYFRTLGLEAVAGRTIRTLDDEPDAPLVAVLSHEGLVRYFGGDPSALGQTIFINDAPHTVVGILPRRFKGTVYPNLPQIYSTFRPVRERRADPPGVLIGRLKNGVSRSQADADLTRVAAQLSDELGVQKTIGTYPATAAFPQFIRVMLPVGALFMIVSASVLYIACSNIGLLLVARAAARRREIGIRLAIGVSRFQLVRQLLIESLLLAFAGGLGASLIAHVTSGWLSQIYLPVPMPIAFVYDFDWRILTFTVAACVAATLLFGLGPALHSLKTDVVSSLKQGAQATDVGRSRTSFSLIVTQVAASTAVLALSVQMIQSVAVHEDRNFDAESVLMATVRLTGTTPRQRNDFVEEMIAGLEDTPGIIAATAVDTVPLSYNNGVPVPVDLLPDSSTAFFDKDTARPVVYTSRIARGSFRTLGAALIQGRDFTSNDTLDTPDVAIVNESLASRFWPEENPIGRLLVSGDGQRIEVVGLSPDFGSDDERSAHVYRPLAMSPTTTPTFLVKFTTTTESAAGLVRKRVAALDPSLVVYNLEELEQRLKPWVHIALGWVSGVLGLLGAFLGAIGTFGLVSWSVHERSREFALRMALGASHSNVMGLTIRGGLSWATVGVLVGLGIFAIGTMVLRSYFRGISSADPIATAAVGLFLLAVTYVACVVPAKRVTSNHPGAILRD